MNEFVEWVQDREYYRGQTQFQQEIPTRRPITQSCEMERRLADLLVGRGIDGLYTYQTDAIGAVRDGQNVVLATSAVSGESLAYAIPAIECAHEYNGRTLYISPQIALINDQETTLSDFATPLDDLSVIQYTGSLPSDERQQAHDGGPSIILTASDMLHCGLLSHAGDLWRAFFESLELVVVDKVHGYRGIFGNHVGLACRQLAWIYDRLGADPQLACCPAMIGNPQEHATTIAGQSINSFELIDENTSEAGPTHWLFWQPPEYDEDDAPTGGEQRHSNHGETVRSFVDLAMQGYRTVIFTRARQMAERHATISGDTLVECGRADIVRSVTAYHAGLRNDRRTTARTALHSGDYAGIWSTGALELGVNIGGLNAVLLDGYPGTQMATFQRAGRADRGTGPSLVALVASEGQLDQYVIKHPNELFK